MKPIATTRAAAGILTGKLAVWMVIASEIPIFGGLLSAYLMNRIGHPEWAFNAADLNVWIGAFNTLVLLSSSLAAMLAQVAAEKGDGRLAAFRLRLAAAGGILFLAVKAYEWGLKIAAGHVPSSSGYWGFYFTATGLHALHIIAGVIILLIIASQVGKNRELQRAELIGIYWHFVDVVWFFLFHLFYIVR